MNSRGMYGASARNLSVTDAGDFLQLRNASDQLVVIHEIRVFQEPATPTLVLNGVNIRRGINGAVGSSHSEWLIGKSGAAAGAAAFSLPTTDVDTADLDFFFGWNLLQEWVYLPTPETRIHLANSDHLGVALNADATATIGWLIIWEEYGT